MQGSGVRQGGQDAAASQVRLSDSLLLDGVRHGDEEAFNELYLRYYGVVYRAALHLLQRSDEAADVAQETFLKLHRQPPSNGREHNVGAWLQRVALNLGYNAMRGERRRGERERQVAEAGVRSEGNADPASEVLRAEKREQVRAVLATMPERYQTALVLRHEGWSYGEIAGVLGIATNAVGTVLARAEKQFKASYDELAGSRRAGK